MDSGLSNELRTMPPDAFADSRFFNCNSRCCASIRARLEDGAPRLPALPYSPATPAPMYRENSENQSEWLEELHHALQYSREIRIQQ